MRVGSVEEGDEFGRVLASGEFLGSYYTQYPKLAVGVPYKTINDKKRAGAVYLIHADKGGLLEQGYHFIHQDLAELDESAEENDQFGFSLSIDHFGQDYQSVRTQDLAIGVPFEDRGVGGTERIDMGVVHVLFGRYSLNYNSYPFLNETIRLDRRNPEILGEANHVDYFGYSLTSGRVMEGSEPHHRQLVVGAMYSTVNDQVMRGAVQIFGFGTSLRAILPNLQRLIENPDDSFGFGGNLSK